MKYPGAIPPPDGIVPNLSFSQSKWNLATHILCITITTAFVFARLYTKHFVLGRTDASDCECTHAVSNVCIPKLLTSSDASTAAWVCCSLLFSYDCVLNPGAGHVNALLGYFTQAGSFRHWNPYVESSTLGCNAVL